MSSENDYLLAADLCTDPSYKPDPKDTAYDYYKKDAVNIEGNDRYWLRSPRVRDTEHFFYTDPREKFSDNDNATIIKKFGLV